MSFDLRTGWDSPGAGDGAITQRKTLKAGWYMLDFNALFGGKSCRTPQRMRDLMKAVVVYRYRVYDLHRDDYVVSTRMATPEKIERVRGKPIPGSEAMIDETHLLDGWTREFYRSMRRGRRARSTQSTPVRAPWRLLLPRRGASSPRPHLSAMLVHNLECTKAIIRLRDDDLAVMRLDMRLSATRHGALITKGHRPKPTGPVPTSGAKSQVPICLTYRVVSSQSLIGDAER